MKLEVKSLLKDLGIPYRWVDHHAVYTVEESLKQIEDKEPIKNLLLQDKSGRYFLVIMSGEKRLDMKNLATKLNSRKLQFANAERLKDCLGVEPGAVSLFGLMNDEESKVTLVIEGRLLSVDELGFHPNDNTATLFIDPRHFKTIAMKLGHEMIVVDL
jgi:Ala-tRNA(Pro) deacylase